MRTFVLLTVIVIIGSFQLGNAAYIEDDQLAVALLNVDAGGEHGSDSPRLVRQYFGRPYGGYRRGYNGFGPRGGYGYRSRPFGPDYYHG